MEVSCSFRLYFYLLIANFSIIVNAHQKLGDDCNKRKGVCTTLLNCPPLLDRYQNNLITYADIHFCNEDEQITCCPKEITTQQYYEETAPNTFQGECKQYYNEVYSKCQPAPLIVSGTSAEAKEFPFMALIAIKDPFKFVCGGSLISREFVLTAAHCYYRLNGVPNLVRLGELDYNTTTDKTETQDFTIKDFILHPTYNYTHDITKQNDIALVRLDRMATFNLYVAPACLPLINGSQFNEFIAIGWGSTKYAASGVTHLAKVLLERYDDDQCQEDLIEDAVLSNRTQICAGSRTSTKDTCSGDSGGPLFVNHPDYPCMYLLIGITSYGFGCGSQNVPAPYTRINLFVDWIEKHVWRVPGIF